MPGPALRDDPAPRLARGNKKNLDRAIRFASNRQGRNLSRKLHLQFVQVFDRKHKTIALVQAKCGWRPGWSETRAGRRVERSGQIPEQSGARYPLTRLAAYGGARADHSCCETTNDRPGFGSAP